MVTTDPNSKLCECALQSIIENDIPPTTISVYSVNRLEIDGLINTYQLNTNHNLDCIEPLGAKHYDYFTDQFNIATLSKWEAINHQLQLDFDFIIFCDLDVVWLNSPIEYFARFFEDTNYSIATQSEGLSKWPPEACTGFMAIRRNEFTVKFFKSCYNAHVELLRQGKNCNDQHVLNDLLLAHPNLRNQVYFLDCSLFPNGQLYNIIDRSNDFVKSELTKESNPYIFHANWVVGEDTKLAFMLKALSIKQKHSRKPIQNVATYGTDSSISVNFDYKSENTIALVVDSAPTTPHLETGLELYNKLRIYAKAVYYYPLFLDLIRFESHLFESAKELVKLKGLLKRKFDLMIENQFLIHGIKPPELNISSLNNYQTINYENFPIGTYIHSTLTFLFRSSFPNYQNELIQEVAKLLYVLGIQSYENTRFAIKKTKANLGIVFNGRFVTTAASKHAFEKEGVKYFLHERGSSADKYQLVDGSLHDLSAFHKRILDYCSNIPKEIIAMEAAIYYHDKRNNTDTSRHNYTLTTRSGKIPSNVLGMKYCVFFHSTDDELSTCGTNNLDVGFGDQLSSCIELSKACKSANLKLLIRLHPNALTRPEEEISRYRSLTTDNVTVISPDDEYNSYDLLDKSTVVATYVSTMGIESLYMLKPTILLGNSMYYFANGIMKPTGLKQLTRFLSNPIIPTSRFSAEQYGMYINRYGYEHTDFKAENNTSGLFKGFNIFE